MKLLRDAKTTSAWFRRTTMTVITALIATIIVATGSVAAQAAPGDYSVEITAPLTVPVSQGFSYNVTVTTPEATAETPATNIVLTAQLPVGTAFDTVPVGGAEVVSNVAYDASTRVVTFTLRELTESLSSFVFTVTQNDNAQKDASTVLSTTVTGSPVTGGSVPTAEASTSVTGTLDFRAVKSHTTLTGSNNRDVTYYFNAQANDSTVSTGAFTSWGQRFTDAFPPGAEVTNTFTDLGGTWTVTGTPAAGQTAVWERNNTSFGPPANLMDSLGRQLAITVRYPENAFPTGTRPPINTVDLEMHTRSGDWESIGTSSTQGPAFLGGADKRISLNKVANSATNAESYTWGNGQWIANYGVNASYLNDFDGEKLERLTVEDSAGQSAANANFFDQSDVFRLNAQFNTTLRAADVPYTLEYTTTGGSDWKAYGTGLTTAQELRLNTVTVGSVGFAEGGFNDYLYLPVGERLTGWRVVLSPGATDTEIPIASEVRVVSYYVPLSQGQASSDESHTNTATAAGVLSDGSSLPGAADSALLRVTDRVPIITHITDKPTTLTVGASTSYGVNIANMDPNRDYRDSVLAFVLPVGVFYDATTGVSRDYASTPVTNVNVPLPGEGLTITTESVTDALGEHQVVLFTFDNLENLRQIGQSKNRNDTLGFRYHIPVMVLPQAYSPSQPSVEARGFAFTGDPVFAAVPMAYYPTYFGADTLNLDPNRDTVAYSTGSSTVATSGGLLIGKTVRTTGSDPWATSAAVSTNGTNEWQIYVSNTLTDAVTDAVIFDRLPQPGDGRGSEFPIELASTISGAPLGSTVEYSTDAETATSGTWTTSSTGATAFRVTVPSISVGASFMLSFASTSNLADQSYGKIATNAVNASVTYQGATRDFVSNMAKISALANPAMTLTKKTNGIRFTEAPGAQIAVDSNVSWTYEVTNTGDTPLDQITVADTFTDGTGTTGTITPTSSVAGVLLPGASRTFTATDTAVAGQYHNSATVSAIAVDLVGNELDEPVATVTDESWYFAGSSGLTVTKTTNEMDVDSAPGVYLSPGTTVSWSYSVTNTGTTPLRDVDVTDVDMDGEMVFNDTIAALNPGETVTLQATGTAISGQYQNTVTASAANPLGGTPVVAADSSYYFGVVAGLEFTKQVSASADGPWGSDVTIRSGDSVFWKFTVTNTGNIDLTDVVLADTALGNIDPISLLPRGETVIRIVKQSNVSTSYINVATVTVQDPSGPEITGEGTATVRVDGSPLPGSNGLSLTGTPGSGWVWALVFIASGVAALVGARRKHPSRHQG